MKISKKERSAFMQLVLEIRSLTPLGIFICISMLGVALMTPEFWPQLIAGFVITGVTLVIGNRSAVNDSKTYSEIIFRNLFLISIGGILVSALTNGHNPNQNNFGPVLWVVCIGLAVFLVAWLFNGDFSDSSNNNFRDYGDDDEWVYHSGFSKLLGIFAIIALVAEIYIHFGTQFIWVPAIVLSVFLEILFQDRRIEYFIKNDVEWVIVIPPTVALISTGHQFWFSKIIFDCTLGQLFYGLVVVLIVILVIVFNYKEKQKEILMHSKKIAQEIENLKKIKNDEDRFASVQFAIFSIKEEKQVLWSDLLCVIRYYNRDVSKFKEILPKIHLAPLAQLVSVSTVKKQIVWNGNYSFALEIVEKLVVESYDDKQLQSLINQLSEFIALIDQYSDYTGYVGVMNEIKSHCGTLYNMLP